MNRDKINIVDNIIYTCDTNSRPDPKGVGHYFYNQMLKYKNKLAQIDGYTKEEDTFGSLLQRSVRVALTIQDKGLKPGDFVSLCTYNHLNSAVPHIASFFTGTIMAAIEPSMSVDEAEHLLKQTLPKLIYVTPTEVPLIEKVVERLGIKTEIVVFGKSAGHTSFEDFLLPHKHETFFRPVEADSLNTVALVVFSSGTSGFPKAICYSHFNMLSSAKEHVPEDTKVLYSIANPYWNVFIAFLQISIHHGHVRVVYPKFNYDEPWTMFYQNVDVGFLNPLQALHMIRSKKPKILDLKSVKVLVIGGNPITLKQLEELKLVIPYTLIKQIYGQSEVFKYVLEEDYSPARSNMMKNNIGSVGTVVLGNSYKVVDIESGNVLGPNIVGELLIKSPSQFVGYLNQDSSECFDSDGWLKTGDLFYYNEDLCFYFVDRVKESFKFYNYHISPTEIETVILKLEAVEDVVVVGIPHETEGNHAIAVIKLKPNAKISVQEIIQQVENSLDDKKRLRGGVKLVDGFPMTGSGKISRIKLKRMILNNEI